jgi:hypothetical protein
MEEIKTTFVNIDRKRELVLFFRFQKNKLIRKRQHKI